ncbi:MAG: hypothetical protein Q7R41_16025 [Phycisphaerales bacterium]|nr:hypothetical protein [Phycisphaerales bacterium]
MRKYLVLTFAVAALFAAAAVDTTTTATTKTTIQSTPVLQFAQSMNTTGCAKGTHYDRRSRSCVPNR